MTKNKIIITSVLLMPLLIIITNLIIVNHYYISDAYILICIHIYSYVRI